MTASEEPERKPALAGRAPRALRAASRRGLRVASPRALPLGVLLAAVLHGSVVGVAALVARPLLPETATLQAREEPLSWFDAELEPTLAALPDSAPPADAPPADAPPADAPLPVVPAPSSAARSGAPAAPPRLAALRRAASGAAPIPSTPSAEAAAAADASGTLPGGAAEQAGAGTAEEKAPAPPALSLEALGIGKNPFLTPPPVQTAAEARAALGRHIDHVLRDGLAQRDQELGLGPEGPAVAKVTELVMQSTTRPNTSALISLRTDASGEVVHVEVAEASGDTDGWNSVAAELLRSLRGKKLRVPGGTGGVTMQLRVDSREQLPSGADPGLAVELFGVDVKKGQGDKSTRVSLLTPKLVLETYQLSPGDPRTEIPVVGLSLTLLSVMGDPTDIGAPARRVVHAHLVSLKTHPLAAP